MKYFVFDIDGTLIDSSKVDQWAMRTALAEFGYEFTYEQLIFSFGMPGRRALAKLSIPAEQVEPIMARWEALAYEMCIRDSFNAVVAKAELLEQVHARLLEPADVVRVVDDAHAVGFVVLDFVVVGNHLKTFFQLEISSAN